MTAQQNPSRPAPLSTRLAPGGREAAVVDAFVDIVDAVTGRRDVGEMLARLVGRCTALLGARSAGILLPDPTGTLVLVACSSSEQAALEHFTLPADEGPCLTCIEDRTPVLLDDLADHAHRWPTWAARAHADGIRSTYAFPLQIRNGSVGVLTVLGDHAAALTGPNRHLADGFARAATAVLTATRDSADGALLTSQLQQALTSRVLVEQAKGVVATSLGTTMDDAFLLIRHHARSTNQRLHVVATDLTTGHLDAQRLRR